MSDTGVSSLGLGVLGGGTSPGAGPAETLPRPMGAVRGAGPLLCGL